MDELCFGEPNLICKACNYEGDVLEELSAVDIEKPTCNSSDSRTTSIWILLNKEEKCCELLDLEDVNLLLPSSKCDLVLSKSYTVNTHATSAVVDHYSKEIHKVLSKDVCFFDLNNSIIVAQVACLPTGSNVALHVIDDERYSLWVTGKCNLMNVLEPSLNEMMFELQRMKEVLIQSEHSVKDCIIKYINWNKEDGKHIGDGFNAYISNLNHANQITENLSFDTVAKVMKEQTKKNKESEVSVLAIVRCNNLLLVENACLSNKCERLRNHMQHGDGKAIDSLAVFKEDFLSQSNERLCNKLTSMQGAMQELLLKQQKSEKENTILYKQLLTLRLEQEQQKLNFNQTASNNNYEKALLKKSISDKEHIIEQATEAGKMLLDDVRATMDLLKDMGKDINFKQDNVHFNETDSLLKVINACRNCINGFSRTILAVHNRAETAEQLLSRMKDDCTQANDESTNLSKTINDFKEDVATLQTDKAKLSVQVSELLEENSLIQEQLSQSNYRNLMLQEDLNKVRKQCTNEINTKIQTLEHNNDDYIKDYTEDLKMQVDNLMNEKHQLLDRIHDAEIQVSNVQDDLEHSEEVLEETRRNYQSYIIIAKRESEEAILELREKQGMLLMKVAELQKDNTLLNEQIELLKRENSDMLVNRNMGVTKSSKEILALRDVIEELSALLEKEKCENTEIKCKLEQIGSIQQIFNSEEIDVEAEIKNINENQVNEELIEDLRLRIQEKDSVINCLLSDGKSGQSELDKLKDEALKWRKESCMSKVDLSEPRFSDIKERPQKTKENVYKKLTKTLSKRNIMCEMLTKECKHKSTEVIQLKALLKESDKQFSNYKEQVGEELLRIERELSIARKRLVEYEEHVCILDKELEKQVKLLELAKKQLAQTGMKVDVLEIEKLNEKLNEKDRDIFNLRERLKSYCDYCVTAQQTVHDWKIKYEVLEQCILEKDSVIKSLENDKRIIDEISSTYNKLASSLIEEERKVDKLDNELESMTVIKVNLEKQLKEKDCLLRISYKDLQTVKEDLANLKLIFQHNSQHFVQLERYAMEKRNFESHLKKCAEEKTATQNAYAALEKEKNELQRDYDVLCDKLVNTIQMLMDNKFDNGQIQEEISHLKGTLFQNKQGNKRDSIPTVENLLTTIQNVLSKLESQHSNKKLVLVHVTVKKNPRANCEMHHKTRTIFKRILSKWKTSLIRRQPE